MCNLSTKYILSQSSYYPLFIIYIINITWGWFSFLNVFFWKNGIIIKKQAVRKCTKLDSLEVKEVQFLAGPFLAFLYIMELVPLALDFINSLMYNASISLAECEQFQPYLLTKIGIYISSWRPHILWVKFKLYFRYLDIGFQ